MPFPWPKSTVCGWEKLAEEEGYGRQLVRSLPFTAVRSLADVPAGAVEAAVENGIVGKVPGGEIRTVSPASKAAGRWAGATAGVLSAPLFLRGLRDSKSHDPATRKKGIALALAAGTGGAAIKGLVEAGVERAPANEVLRRALIRGGLGLPAAASTVWALSHRRKGQESSSGAKALLGGIAGAGAGALKGGIEAAFENKALRHVNPALFRRAMLGKALGRAAGGAVKGLALTALIDRLTKKRK